MRQPHSLFYSSGLGGCRLGVGDQLLLLAGGKGLQPGQVIVAAEHDHSALAAHCLASGGEDDVSAFLDDLAVVGDDLLGGLFVFFDIRLVRQLTPGGEQRPAPGLFIVAAA